MEDAVAELLTEPVWHLYAILWRFGLVEVD